MRSRIAGPINRSRLGPASLVGEGIDTSASIGVPKDGPGNVYLPGSAANFTSLGLVVPDSLWLCQEASGNLADSIGAVPLTANAAPAYQQAVTGWAAKAVQFTDGTALQRFAAAIGVGPTPVTTSSLWGWYVSVLSAPVANRVLTSVADGAVMQRSQILTTKFLRDNCNAVTADGTTDMTTVGVDLIFVQYDRANSVAAVYSSHEKLVTTYSALVVDALKGIGATAGAPPSSQFLRGWMYQGAKAEISSAAVKAIYTGLGWSPPWS